MADLGPHASDDLVIFNGDETPAAATNCSSDGLDVDLIDEWIVDDRCGFTLSTKQLGGFKALAEENTAADEYDIRSVLDHFEFNADPRNSRSSVAGVVNHA